MKKLFAITIALVMLMGGCGMNSITTDSEIKPIISVGCGEGYCIHKVTVEEHDYFFVGTGGMVHSESCSNSVHSAKLIRYR